jgi:hypothetical protein
MKTVWEKDGDTVKPKKLNLTIGSGYRYFGYDKNFNLYLGNDSGAPSGVYCIYPGAIWESDKIISMDAYPTKEFMEKMITDFKKYNINLNEYKIHLQIMLFKDFDNSDFAKEVIDQIKSDEKDWIESVTYGYDKAPIVGIVTPETFKKSGDQCTTVTGNLNRNYIFQIKNKLVDILMPVHEYLNLDDNRFDIYKSEIVSDFSELKYLAKMNYHDMSPSLKERVKVYSKDAGYESPSEFLIDLKDPAKYDRIVKILQGESKEEIVSESLRLMKLLKIL